MKRILSLLTVFLALPVAFTATAFAAGEASPDGGSLLDLARPVFDAVMSGQYVAAAMLALVLATALARKYGGPKWPFLMSDSGGTLLTFLGSFGGAAATALFAAGPGAMISFALFKTALLVAVGASGGYTAFKRLLLPLVRRLRDACPPWLQVAFLPILWWFESPAAAAAKRAGDAAVADKPASGLDAPREMP